MSAGAMQPRGRGRVLASSLLAGLVLLSLCELPAAAVGVAATSSTRSVFRVAPSGGDDTQSIQAALDAASAAGPGAVIQLARGVFRVGRPLVGLNLDVTIRGAGMGRTQILADGGVNPDGLFQLLPAGEAAALRSLATAYLLLFVESDVDRFGEPVGTRRSQRVALTDLTLGARGRTVAHFDPNEDFDTQRLFSLVWVEGYRPDWTNSQEQTPATSGGSTPSTPSSPRCGRASGRSTSMAGTGPAATMSPADPWIQPPTSATGSGWRAAYPFLSHRLSHRSCSSR